MISTDIIEQNSAATITNTGPSTKSTELGQDDFLRMLIAQLSNQDPLSPQDGTEFSAQLAQFTSLEQLIGMREQIEALVAVQSQAQTLGAVGLIGKNVLVRTNQFEIDPSASELPKLSFELSASADILSIEILDENGRLAARIDNFGQQQAGITEIDWADFSRQPGPGLYTLRINQIQGATAQPLVEARVTGTAINEGVVFMGRAEANLADVREVRE